VPKAKASVDSTAKLVHPQILRESDQQEPGTFTGWSLPSTTTRPTRVAQPKTGTEIAGRRGGQAPTGAFTLARFPSLHRQGANLEDVLRSVLRIEEQARAIIAEAERDSKDIVAHAESEAAQLLVQSEKEAAQEAEHIRVMARSDAEEARQRILADASRGVKRLEEQATPRLEDACAHVVRSILN